MKPVIAVALAIVAVMLVVPMVVGHNECQRVQELRDAHNATTAAVWLTDDSASKREFKLAVRGPKKGRKIHRINAYSLRRIMARLRYQPPTDCGAALLPGYRRDGARPFTATLANALTR